MSGTVFAWILLTGLLCGSLLALGYVLFFQPAFAREGSSPEPIIYEEPNPPAHSEDGEEIESVVEHIVPKVAIIIDDMGYDEELGRRLLQSSFELNYSFLPFAPYTRKLEALAHRYDKTILLHLPLEPRNYRWGPGPGALFLKDTPEVRAEKFIRNLAEVPHAKGVNNHMGSRFTEDAAAMRQVLGLIDERNLFFIDSFTSSNSVAYDQAVELGLSRGKRQVFLDNVLDGKRICSQLEKLVATAEKKGMAIGIGHPHTETVEALEQCLPEMAARVEFVSILELLQ